MAQRRMFSKQVTNSSEFLMMSPSAQALYLHFGMNADDDGFCEVFTIMRMTDSKPDDLQALHSRGFVYVIDGKVCVVKDWHENNQIRIDRYKKSVYLSDPKYSDIYKTIMDDKIKEISVYKELLSGKPNGNQMEPQVRLGKVRLGKITTGSVPSPEVDSEGLTKALELWNRLSTGKDSGKDYYKNTSAKTRLLPKCVKTTDKLRLVFKRLDKEYTPDQYLQIIKRYVVEILNREPSGTYYKHRFSFYEFFKQENGFIKFISND